VTSPIVVKVGGSTLGSHDTVLADIADLHKAGRQVVLVHGGGNPATEWLKVHGVVSEFVDGLRVTGPEAIDVVTAVFGGLVNKQLVAELQSLGAPAFGLSGADAGLLTTRQLDERLGFVGEITAVERRSLDLLLTSGYLPVVAPLGYWPQQGRLMNLNADTVAGEIAASLGALDLIFMTDVAFVRDGEGDPIDAIAATQVAGMIESGVATGGMIPKLQAGARAAAAGVACYVVDGREEHALRRVLAGEIMGTRVTA
jgi:acetylglutamate kinase